MLWTTVFLIALVFGQVPAKSTPVAVDFIENVSKGDSRIVSGWEARPGQHPHHVNLRMQSAAGQLASCGGSIVHRHWVLSAAHCTALRVNVMILAGMVHLSQATHILETREWYNYPTYVNDMVLIVQPNDITLIKVQQAIIFTDFVKPIRVQPRADAFRNYDGKVVYASGHGRTWTDGSTPSALQWVYMRAMSNPDCQRWYGATLINANSICARYFNVTSQSTCHGDSGGPLVLEEHGVATLVGVISFVAGAQSGGCHSGLPAGFIRPGPFHSWFTSVTGIDFDNLDEWETPSTTSLPPTTPTEQLITSTLPPTEPPTTEEVVVTTREPTIPSWSETPPQPPFTTTWLPTSTEHSSTGPWDTTPTEPDVPTTTWSPEPTTTEKPDDSEEQPEESEENQESGEEGSEEESDSDENSDEDCDPELSELLKKLEVEVKVKIKMNKKKHKIHHQHSVTHRRRPHHH